MRISYVLALVAGPAFADDDLMAFFEGQGCTIGAYSRALAVEAGYSSDEIAAFEEARIVEGQSTRQGDYLVMGAEICTIRLPDIKSRWSVDDPEIIAMAPFIDKDVEWASRTIPVDGCFFENPMEQFVALNDGDEEAGYRDYISFMAAGLVSGDIRYYSDDPLWMPLGAQLLTGECAKASNADVVRENHAYLVSGFGPWVRQAYDMDQCTGTGSFGDWRFSLLHQGLDPDGPREDQPVVNAVLAFEWMMITTGARWRVGDTASEKGEEAPPLCRYE